MAQQEWDGMSPALSANKFDMIVASMAITEQRKEVVDFSDPYYDVPSPSSRQTVHSKATAQNNWLARR